MLATRLPSARESSASTRTTQPATPSGQGLEPALRWKEGAPGLWTRGFHSCCRGSGCLGRFGDEWTEAKTRSIAPAFAPCSRSPKGTSLSPTRPSPFLSVRPSPRPSSRLRLAEEDAASMEASVDAFASQACPRAWCSKSVCLPAGIMGREPTATSAPDRAAPVAAPVAALVAAPVAAPGDAAARGVGAGHAGPAAGHTASGRAALAAPGRAESCVMTTPRPRT